MPKFASRAFVIYLSTSCNEPALISCLFIKIQLFLRNPLVPGTVLVKLVFFFLSAHYKSRFLINVLAGNGEFVDKIISVFKDRFEWNFRIRIQSLPWFCMKTKLLFVNLNCGSMYQLRRELRREIFYKNSTDVPSVWSVQKPYQSPSANSFKNSYLWLSSKVYYLSCGLFFCYQPGRTHDTRQSNTQNRTVTP